MTLLDARGTRVDTIDSTTGTSLGSLSLPGGLSIRAVAPRGSAVALMPVDGASADAYTPASRSTTVITVVEAESDLEVTHRLDGNLEPEIFSTDGDMLFLLEYWPPLEPDRYFMRQLDVASGEIADVHSPEVDLQPEMRGTARAQAMDPGGATRWSPTCGRRS
ncbi:MAG TPA: hypothetical protein VMQ81_03715 [Acidimicrobiia bacterium]|nr:hypothetical protein [Acidimicrobiia bacterium]